ncbi:uncharacterized protein C8Q71DRAFT_720270 [Rhodofomes roseus]|uniref:Uncharacterized protein n=1 Tax=Rhodofomes roseus TaxID=34475 RepID=A0ABQ8KX11_9APHY|nr:uncharacterized protein C8Q71DRAFT_720270 [Rhodofomes roseus]KAH9842845.1 hypothetical protein C8Q71DRAFT_720270 [Rhodofomes roseus]
MTAPQSPSSASTPANSTAVTLSSVPTSAFLTGSESPIQNGSSSTSLPSTLISGIRPSNRASSPVATSNATASPDGADASASSPRHKSTAAIAGGIVGGLLGLLLLLGSLLWLRRRQRRLRVPPSAEFMGVVGAFSPEPLRATPRFKLARDSSYEPGEPPPPFIPSAYSDQFFEKEKGAGGEEERSEGEDDAEGYMDGSMDETLHDTSSHDEKIVESSYCDLVGNWTSTKRLAATGTTCSSALQTYLQRRVLRAEVIYDPVESIIASEWSFESQQASSIDAQANAHIAGIALSSPPPTMPPILGTVTPADPAAAPANQPYNYHCVWSDRPIIKCIDYRYDARVEDTEWGHGNIGVQSVQHAQHISAKHHSHTAAIAGGVIGMLAVLFLASGVWFMWRRRGRRIAPSTWFMATGILPKPGLVPVQSRFVRLDAGEDEDPPPAYERAFEEAAPTHAERGAIDEKSESRVSRE